MTEYLYWSYMEDQIIHRLKNFWQENTIWNFQTASLSDIAGFSIRYKLCLPEDLANYFNIVNGTQDDCDDNLFEFYSLSQFETVKDGLEEWQGIPNYKGISELLPDAENCFVFGNYCFHLFAYAIRLNAEEQAVNEVYVICGQQFKVIAHSFSEFLNLYLEDNELIYF